jgi:zinc transporter, ZIP family
MLEAGLWGLVAASSLVIGAALGIWLPISRRLVALIMGFGAGALVSALSFDLTAEAFAEGGAVLTALGLAAGGLTFFVGDVLLERSARDRHTGKRKAGGGLALLLGVLLDGLPESFVLGASLIGGAGVSPSFLVAVFLSNLPEGLAGARDMREEGGSEGRIMATWIVVALVSGVAAAIGFAFLGTMSGEPLGLSKAFAAGAILTMLADTMFPEAYESGGKGVGLTTLFGFALAFFLSAIPT